jgi:hypothetical protein
MSLLGTIPNEKKRRKNGNERIINRQDVLVIGKASKVGTAAT